MNELQKSLLDALSRIEEEQTRRLDKQDQKIAELEKEVQGCRDLQSELEQVLNELERLAQL